MKCQICFMGKLRKIYFKMSSAENFTQNAMLKCGKTIYGALD